MTAPRCMVAAPPHPLPNDSASSLTPARTLALTLTPTVTLTLTLTELAL
jgi:hypothetical protein